MKNMIDSVYIVYCVYLNLIMPTLVLMLFSVVKYKSDRDYNNNTNHR